MMGMSITSNAAAMEQPKAFEFIVFSVHVGSRHARKIVVRRLYRGGPALLISSLRPPL
jgi:hypothetical protein